MRTMPVILAAAVVLWAAAIAGVCAGLPTRAMCVILAAATTVSVMAYVRRAHDADRRATLLAVADLTRPRGGGLRATTPLPQVIPLTRRAGSAQARR